MMVNRRFGSLFNKKMIILIAVILSIGLIGVGYAKWDSGIGMQIGVSTGYAKPELYLNQKIMDFDDGKLSLSLSPNNDILEISGEVYPGFNQSIILEVKDKGSVPSVFEELHGDNGKIIDLQVNEGAYNNRSFANDETIQNFKLSINLDSNESYYEGTNSDSDYSDDILTLEDQISILREEIQRYQKYSEEYEFEYTLYFKQDIESGRKLNGGKP